MVAKKIKPKLINSSYSDNEENLTNFVNSKLSGFYSSEISEIDKKLKISSGSAQQWQRMSTGVLVADFLMGGGICPGMYTISGPEQSAKSTLTNHAFGQSLKHPLSWRNIWDAEGSMDPTYSGNIWRASLPKVFPSMAKYYQEQVIEDYFDQLVSLLQRMPNKIWSDETKSFVYQVARRNGGKILDSFKEFGMKPEKNLTDDAYYYVVSDSPYIEALTIVDSWPAMVTDDVEEFEAGKKRSNAMAVNARAFSLNLGRVAGKLRKKGVCLFGVNQIREKVGVIYGSPEYEPGGQALKFYSMVRNSIRATSVPEGWDKSKEISAVNAEESVIGNGLDHYQFKTINNTKNKFSTPFLKGKVRIWVKDHAGKGLGIDPVFDTAEFLRLCGKLLVNGKNISNVTQNMKKIEIKGFAPLAGKSLTWIQFKKLILAEHLNDRELTSQISKELNLAKTPLLRQWCFKLLRDDPASLLLVATKQNQEESEYDQDTDE